MPGILVSRRRCLASALAMPLAGATPIAGLLGFSSVRAADANASKVLDLGSRRELFVDDFLIERFGGKAELRLHQPAVREVAIEFNEPWEGNATGYHMMFHDGQKFRMYYRGGPQLTVSPGKLSASRAHFCYAESDDGLQWRKPELGLFEFNGSRKNNILFGDGPLGPATVHLGHGVGGVFVDGNPKCLPEARFKALICSSKPNGMFPFQSADGLKWTPMGKEPLFSKAWLDSLNVAYWDAERGEYRAYIRAQGRDGRRGIHTSTSADFVHWSEPQVLDYSGVPDESAIRNAGWAELPQFYTNSIRSYPRAPHLFVGFPGRYFDRNWSEPMRELPDRENRELRAASSRRYGTAITEGAFISSRDGRAFRTWGEAFLRPGPETSGTWNYGQNFIAWHPIETASRVPDKGPELSIFAGEGYWLGKGNRLRRYALRLDGFVSVTAPWSGGEFVTRPFTFTGNQLSLNFESAAAGGIKVEIQDAAGAPIAGYALADCAELFGDTVDRAVIWKGGRDIGALAGKPVRLKFVLRDADLYAMQFRPA